MVRVQLQRAVNYGKTAKPLLDKLKAALDSQKEQTEKNAQACAEATTKLESCLKQLAEKDRCVRSHIYGDRCIILHTNDVAPHTHTHTHTCTEPTRS
jgi:hypothetical protein